VSSVAAFDDFPRRGTPPLRNLRRIHGSATVTSLRSSAVHPLESRQRRDRVARILNHLDTYGPKKGPIAESMAELPQESWDRLAEMMEEKHPFSRTTQRQVIAALREREWSAN